MQCEESILPTWRPWKERRRHNRLRYHNDSLDMRDDVRPIRRRDLCRLTVTDIEVFGVKRYLVICRNVGENIPAGEDCGLVKGVSPDLGLKCFLPHNSPDVCPQHVDLRRRTI